MKEPTNNRLPSSAFLLFHVRLMTKSGRVAQRITRLPTEQKIAGSSPAVVDSLIFSFCQNGHIFHLLDSFLLQSVFSSISNLEMLSNNAFLASINSIHFGAES